MAHMYPYFPTRAESREFEEAFFFLFFFLGGNATT